MKRLRFLFVTAMVVMVAVAMSACGGGGGASTTDTEADAAVTDVAEFEEIEVVEPTPEAEVDADDADATDPLLDAAAEEVNKTCPMVIDDVTTMEYVESLPNRTLKYVYTINYASTELSADVIATLASDTKANFIELVRTDSTMAFLKQFETSFEIVYFGSDGVELCYITITPEEYAD